MAYVATMCRDDLRTFYSNVQSGEECFVQCVDKSKDKVSDQCEQAQRDVGLK